MTTTQLTHLLDDFKAGRATRAQVLRKLQSAPVNDLGFALVDHHRSIRKNFPEVIFGEGKTPPQVVQIAAEILKQDHVVLATRVRPEHARALKRRFPKAKHHPIGRCVTIERKALPRNRGKIAVLCAGTSDLPVAEEAAITAEIMGNDVIRLRDVGVAGLHRLTSRIDLLREANVIVAVAGMEGALPSVVAGLVAQPVIAAPTSVGYGASFQGLAALLGMLNSCGSGVTVVNIDNGFGAGFAAAQINAQINRARFDGSEEEGL